MFKKRQIRQQTSRSFRDVEIDDDDEESHIGIGSSTDIESLTSGRSKSRLALLGDEDSLGFRKEKGGKKKRKDRSQKGEELTGRPIGSSTFISIFSDKGDEAFGLEEELEVKTKQLRQPIESSGHLDVNSVSNSKNHIEEIDVDSPGIIVEESQVDLIDEDEEDSINVDSALLELVRQKRERNRTKGGGSRLFGAMISSTRPLSKTNTQPRQTVFKEDYKHDSDEDDEWEVQQALKGVGTSRVTNTTKIARSIRNDEELMQKQKPAVRYAGDHTEKMSDIQRMLRPSTAATSKVTHSVGYSDHEVVLDVDTQLDSEKEQLHPILEDDSLFDSIDAQLSQLNSHLNTLTLSTNKMKEERELMEQTKIDAARDLENTHESDTADAERLDFFQRFIEIIDDLADLTETKTADIDVAYDALYEMEKEYMIPRQLRRLQEFRDDLETCGVNVIGCSTTESTDEFGRSRGYHILKTKEDRRDIQKRKNELRKNQRLQKLREMLSNSTSDAMLTKVQSSESAEVEGGIIYGVQQGDDGSKEIEVYGIDGWSTDEDVCDKEEESFSECESQKYKDEIIEMYKKNRANFCSAVVNIFADVEEDYGTVDGVIKKVREVLKRYPTEFKESCWNLGIRDIIALLVRYDLLLWDPFISNTYWDLNQRQLSKWNAKADGIEALRWNVPVVDLVLDIGEDPSENLMSYIVFKVVVPHFQHWIDSCWDPVSRKQTKQIVEIIKMILQYRESPYIPDLQSLFNIIIQRFRKIMDDYINIPRLNTSLSSRKLTEKVLWRSVKLSRNIALFKDIISASTLQDLIWKEITVNRLLKFFDSMTNDHLSPSAINALILIAASPPPPSAHFPLPVEIVIQLSSALEKSPIPSFTCVNAECQKLQLRHIH